jgi:CO dehydrogenase/acetyl-CoA synthase gamma subunit (corrinoid Fe-S protein)
MRYTVEPGIYAIGEPTAESPVFVSANYRLSFNRLRSGLAGRDGWILVLDTKGINVWCAAGKGTFGTEELVNRIETVGLGGIVAHRKLIVPQLGAPGISAHEVKQQSGSSLSRSSVLLASARIR